MAQEEKDTMNVSADEEPETIEEKLTEFEKALDVFAYNSKLEASNPNYYTWLLKSTALNLLDLARKELLKDMPKWKKITKPEQEYLAYGFLSWDDYYLSIGELKRKLPKEK